MSTELHHYMAALGTGARKASRAIAAAPTAQKNQALLAMAQALRTQRTQLAAANARDLEAAAKAGLEAAMVDRLTLTDKGIEQMAQGLEQVAALADPVGEITDVRMRPSGIQVGKMRAPIGVIGIVYEARPNVTADAAALCLKAGNAAILRGGKEALYCNQAIAACVRAGLAEAGLPEAVIQVVNTTDRALVDLLVTSPQYVDVIVPRGGKGLIERITDTARVPVIKHLDGNCHVFVDDQADAATVVPVIENAKTQRYGTCNTTESLLLTAMAAEKFLPAIGRMFTARQVQMRCCPGAYEILRQSGVPADLLRHAVDADWYTEFLGPVIAVRIVADVDEAIAHINEYGSGHTDAILTEHYAHAMQFLREVDSASVMVNASTRFADGFEYGLGAEIGISTDRIHARGPVGLEGLTNQKWIVLGSGQVRG